jgi:hypothetical protein
VQDQGIQLTSALTLDFSTSLKGAAFFQSLQAQWKSIGVTSLATLIKNFPEAWAGMITAMRANGLYASDLEAFFSQNANMRGLIGSTGVGVLISGIFAGAQFAQDRNSQNPLMWINLATNIEKALIGTAIGAITVGSLPALTPLGSIVLGAALIGAQTLADSSETTYLNNWNSTHGVPLAGPGDFGPGGGGGVQSFPSSTTDVIGSLAAERVNDSGTPGVMRLVSKRI